MTSDNASTITPIRRLRNLFLSLSLSIFFIGCSSVEVRDEEPVVVEPTAVVTSATETQSETTDTSTAQASVEPDPVVIREKSTASQIVGAVAVTAVTIWAVTEYIEEKIVPALTGLLVIYLISQAADHANQESAVDQM